MSITWCSSAFFKSLHVVTMDLRRCQLINIYRASHSQCRYPYSTSVSVGGNAQFNCDGHGSYLNWYIDGINTEDMSSEEIVDRGISSSGYFPMRLPVLLPYNGW